MRLAQFILQNMESILEQWETFAREIQPDDGDMSHLELRDHAEAMLKVIALDLGTPQTREQSVEKSEGNAPGGRAVTPAHLHADERLRAGFSIMVMVSEYRALRASVLALWAKDAPTEPSDFDDMLRFNEAIDQALAESVDKYSGLIAESQDTFLGILGHDLRSPLQSVSVGAAYLMRAPDIDARLIQLGARMYNSAARMGDMLDDLLDYTRLRIGGGLTLSLQPTNLAMVVSQIVEEFRSSNPGRIIHIAADHDCVGLFDGRRIGQVCQNLLSNALQYSEPDTAIDMTLRSSADEVQFIIRNKGCPIPLSAQKTLFDPLRRHASGNAEEALTNTNLGLGLYIARQVTIAHHGTIEVVSTEVDGTVFTVTLPKSASVRNSPIFDRMRN